MSIAASTRQDILNFITSRGKIPTADVFTRFELMSKRAIEDHLTALVTAGAIVRGAIDVAPARGHASHISDEDVEVAPPRKAAPVEAKPKAKASPPKAATEIKTDPADKPRERVIELFRHRASWHATEVYAALSDVPAKTVYSVLWYQVQRGHLSQKGDRYTRTAIIEPSLQDRIDALFDTAVELKRRVIVAHFPDVKRGAVTKTLTKMTQRKRLAQRGDFYRRFNTAAPETPGYVKLSSPEIKRRVRQLGSEAASPSSNGILGRLETTMTGAGINAAVRQPPPKPGQVDVIDLVVPEIQRYFGDYSDIAATLVHDLYQRAAEGKKKYGTLLQTHNGHDADMDAYQEVCDLVMYMRQRLEERFEAGESITEYRTRYHAALELMAYLRTQLSSPTQIQCSASRMQSHVEHSHGA